MCVAPPAAGRKTQLHVLPGCCSELTSLSQFIGITSLYRGVQMCKIYIKPRLFMHVLLILEGVHEIAALSWFFCVMTKEHNQIKRIDLTQVIMHPAHQNNILPKSRCIFAPETGAHCPGAECYNL